MIERLVVGASIVYCALAGTKTPQMGWNSWNKFACDIDENLIKETADALVSTGLADLGYVYVNLDDCWQASERDENGLVQVDSARFPSGLKALGEYIHSKGLKFGIYSSAGFKTCQGFPASLGLEEIDAKSYAEWGVDYLKYDNCYQDHGLPTSRYGEMKKALDDSGRDIFYSLCEWGRENPAVWAPGIGADSWRISGDIWDGWSSIITRMEITAPLWRYAGPEKGWNDPDMLEVGNGGCSEAEYRAHFSIWAMLKAPMIIGNDIRNLTSTPDSEQNKMIMSILGNKEVLAISQDPLGRQARLVWSDTSAYLQESVESFGDKLIATKCSTGASEAYEDAPLDQSWALQDDGTIKSSSTGLCLSEVSLDKVNLFDHKNTPEDKKEEALAAFIELTPIPVANTTAGMGSSVGRDRQPKMHSVSTQDCATATRWEVGKYIGGSVVSKDSNLCLEVAKEDFYPKAQGKRIQTGPCQYIKGKQYLDVTEHQSWTQPSGTSLLNLYQRQCLTVDRDAFAGARQEIWMGPLEGGSMVVLLLNKARLPAIMTLEASLLGIADDDTETAYDVRNLWIHETLLRTIGAGDALKLEVNSHDVVMLKLTPRTPRNN